MQDKPSGKSSRTAFTLLSIVASVTIAWAAGGAVRGAPSSELGRPTSRDVETTSTPLAADQTLGRDHCVDDSDSRSLVPTTSRLDVSESSRTLLRRIVQTQSETATPQPAPALFARVRIRCWSSDRPSINGQDSPQANVSPARVEP